MEHAIQRTSGDKDAYENARLTRIFNLRRPPNFPLAILQATSSEDVVSAIHHATHQGCQLSVRSGGHSMFVWSLHQDSILIDLGSWKEIALDKESNIVKATPSVTSKELNDYLRNHGLFIPSGHFPEVGLGGFLLQGGQGWNCRNWGWACDRLVAVEVVTAQGKQLLCNDHQNQDLYWAAKGSGPLFPGIVTKFHLQLQPYPCCIRSSVYIYPARHYQVVFDWVQSTVPDSDQDTEIVMIAFSSKQHREVCFKVNFVVMKTSASQAEDVLHRMHQGKPSGSIFEMVCREDSLDQLYKDQTMANPESHYYYVDNRFIKNEANITTALEEAFLCLPPGKSFAFWYPMYPRSRKNGHGMALDVPSDHYFAIYAVAEDQNEAERGRAWVKKIMANITEYAVGSYIGDSDLKLGHEWYWTKNKAQRLGEIRNKWDPKGLFCTVHT